MASNSSPRYAIVARTLSERIAAGQYPVGGLLPTEHELSAELGVSRQTVREAIRRLADMGMLTRQPGVGTRVVRSRGESRYSHRMQSLSELIDYAHDVPLAIHKVEQILARGELARMLSCRPRTPWLWARGHRRRPGDDTLFTVSDIYIRPDYPGLETRLLHSPGPIYDLLERVYDEPIEEVRQEILAVSLDAETARMLSVEAGSPGMAIHRRFIGKADRLIMYGRSVSPGSRFSYLTTFRRETSHEA